MWGDTSYYVPPAQKVGGHVSPVPPRVAPPGTYGYYVTPP